MRSLISHPRSIWPPRSFGGRNGLRGHENFLKRQYAHRHQGNWGHWAQFWGEIWPLRLFGFRNSQNNAAATWEAPLLFWNKCYCVIYVFPGHACFMTRNILVSLLSFSRFYFQILEVEQGIEFGRGKITLRSSPHCNSSLTNNRAHVFRWHPRILFLELWQGSVFSLY